MTIAASLATGASLAFLGLVTLDARAQYYLGGQAGWTGLPYETDTFDHGVGAIPVDFSTGYNVGGRGGYRFGPGVLKKNTAIGTTMWPNTTRPARGSTALAIPSRS
jgi:hypothetical protein